MSFLGHKHTEESKIKTKESMKKWWKENIDSDIVKNRNLKITNYLKGKKKQEGVIEALMRGHNEYVKKYGYPMSNKISWARGLTKETDERVKHVSEGRKKWWDKNKNSEVAKERNKKLSQNWKDPNSYVNSKKFRENRLKLTLKSLFKRPTGTEFKFINFFSNYNLPYKYVGNGICIIGGWCPDFIENNGRKICIEVSTKRFRNHFYKEGIECYEERRISHFAKYGWKCLVLWEENLKNNEVDMLEKISNLEKSKKSL